MLRDHLVVCISNDRILRHLFAEKTLTFAKARELALAQETAEQNADEIIQGEKVAIASEGKSTSCLEDRNREETSDCQR